MDFNKIERLLERYWEGETSLEEEQVLRDFFDHPEVPGKWKSEQVLFQYFTEQRKVDLDELFDEKVMAQVEEAPDISRGKVRKLFYDLVRVAAVGLILVTATYFVREQYLEQKDDPYMVDTFENPKEAFEETKKALLMISKNFNKGRKEAKKVGAFNDAQEKVKSGNEL